MSNTGIITLVESYQQTLLCHQVKLWLECEVCRVKVKHKMFITGDTPQ